MLGGSAFKNCEDCGKQTSVFWTITNMNQDKSGHSEILDVKILCNDCYVKHIAKMMSDRKDYDWQWIPVGEIYRYVYGAFKYDKEKMRVILKALEMVIEQAESAKSNASSDNL